mmetsp:Transcript_10187/g.28817  ORF Transcript_10187/g.28817 Transcript_10187/m.28817 type:complete len:406 (-) Transcript_10187:349-1566(-)
MHVGGRDRRQELEGLVDALLLRKLQVLLRKSHNEMHARVGVVLLVIRDEGLLFLLHRLHEGLQKVLVVLGPLPQWKLHDLDGLLVNDVDDAAHGEALALVRAGALGDHPRDLPLESLVPRDHTLHRHSRDVTLHICGHVLWVVVGNGRAPTSANAVGSVEENEGKDWEVPLGLDALPVLVQVVEEPVVLLTEQVARQRPEPGVNVPWGGAILATLQPGSELPRWEQQVHVVGPNVVLGQANNGAGKTLLSVVVRRVLRDVSRELGDLDVGLEVALEPTVHDLPLAGLEAIEDTRNGPLQISPGEQDQFLVDEVLVRDLRAVVVQESPWLERVQPPLPVIHVLLREHHLDQLAVLIASVREVLGVLLQVSKVLLGFLCRGSTQTLVVLDLPALLIRGGLLPALVLW